jgi:chromosome condensin MukBEF ATPase and DNA-binding subunit MukB
MSDAAHVTDLAVLTELRSALLTFASAACEALSAADLEIRRAHEWLQVQLQVWQQEVRRAEDEVFACQQELARRRLIRVGDRPPDCTEQEKALRRARARLEWAQQQRDRTRAWLHDLPRAVNDYAGPSRQLQDLLEADLPRICALLARKAQALWEYVERRSPPPPDTP